MISQKVISESEELIGILLKDAREEMKEAYLKADGGLAVNLALKFNPVKEGEIEVQAGISFVTSKFQNRLSRRVSSKQLDLLPPGPPPNRGMIRRKGQ